MFELLLFFNCILCVTNTVNKCVSPKKMWIMFIMLQLCRIREWICTIVSTQLYESKINTLSYHHLIGFPDSFFLSFSILNWSDISIHCFKFIHLKDMCLCVPVAVPMCQSSAKIYKKYWSLWNFIINFYQYSKLWDRWIKSCRSPSDDRLAWMNQNTHNAQKKIKKYQFFFAHSHILDRITCTFFVW